MVLNSLYEQAVGPALPSEIKHHEEASMKAIYYIGLDIHKKTIAYCIKTIDGGACSAGNGGSRAQGACSNG